MAEVRKKVVEDKYNTSKIKSNKVKKKKMTENEKETNNKKNKDVSIWTKFRIFCNGVKSEFHKVHWTSKKDMIKYSIACIIFIIFCSLFFYGIDVVFAFIQSLFD